MISMIDTVSPGVTSGLSASNALSAASARSRFSVSHGAETAALDEHGFLVEHLRRLQHLPRRREHGGARQAELHEAQAQHTIVDALERVSREVDEVDLDAVRREAVEQRLEQPLRRVVQEARAVDQVHADDAERLLLRRVLEIEHADVNDDLLVGAARPRLKPNAHPAVALVVAAEAARRDRVGEREERRAVAALRAEPLEIEPLLVVEHRLEPLAADVALAGAVNRVADLHVVRRDALGDRAGGGAGVEKPAHDLLARADLGERAVETGIQVDPEGLVPRRNGMWSHGHQSLQSTRNGRGRTDPATARMPTRSARRRKNEEAAARV